MNNVYTRIVLNMKMNLYILNLIVYQNYPEYLKKSKMENQHIMKNYEKTINVKISKNGKNLLLIFLKII